MHIYEHAITEDPVQGHTDDCVLDGFEVGECQPIISDWDQPSGWAVSEAEAELGDDMPWCQVRSRAWDLSKTGIV